MKNDEKSAVLVAAIVAVQSAFLVARTLRYIGWRWVWIFMPTWAPAFCTVGLVIIVGVGLLIFGRRGMDE